MQQTVMNRAEANPRTGVALAATTVAVALLLLTATAGATGQVGEVAADFSLLDTNNNLVSLENTAGNVRFLFMVGWG